MFCKYNFYFLFADRDWPDHFYSRVDAYAEHSERLRLIEEILFQKNQNEILKSLKCSSWKGTDQENAVADSKIRYFAILVTKIISMFCSISSSVVKVIITEAGDL